MHRRGQLRRRGERPLDAGQARPAPLGAGGARRGRRGLCRRGRRRPPVAPLVLELRLVGGQLGLARAAAAGRGGDRRRAWLPFRRRRHLRAQRPRLLRHGPAARHVDGALGDRRARRLGGVARRRHARRARRAAGRAGARGGHLLARRPAPPAPPARAAGAALGGRDARLDWLLARGRADVGRLGGRRAQRGRRVGLRMDAGARRVGEPQEQGGAPVGHRRRRDPLPLRALQGARRLRAPRPRAPALRAAPARAGCALARSRPWSPPSARARAAAARRSPPPRAPRLFASAPLTQPRACGARRARARGVSISPKSSRGQ